MTKTKARRGAEGEDRLESNARAGDGGRSGPALRGPPEPDLCGKERFLEQASRAFDPNVEVDAEKVAQRQVDDLYAKISQLTVERDFGQEVRAMSTPDRRGMLDTSNESLSARRQCELLGVARSGVYRAKPAAGEGEPAREGGSYRIDTSEAPSIRRSGALAALAPD